MLSVEDVKRFYEYFFGKKYGNSKFAYPALPKEEKLIENFLHALDKEYGLPSLGYNFLWKYFVFQFSYWDELELKQVSKIQPSFIIGKNAVERYDSRDANYDWQLSNARIVTKYKLSFDVLMKKVEKTNSEQRQVSYTDRIFRARYLNTDKGLVSCIEYTSLYDHRDPSCLTCIYKKECKELLKVNYPILYSQRGYGK